MKKFRTIITVSALVCAFTFVIGVCMVGAFELCWQTGPSGEEILRLNLRPIRNGNWLLNGFVENNAGQINNIVHGNGRFVGTEFIMHITASGYDPLDPDFFSFIGTVVLDAATFIGTVEGVGIRATRATSIPGLSYDGVQTVTQITCP